MALKYDIYIKIAQSTFETDSFSYGLSGSPSKFTAGFYKTIFKWVKCLLTAPGSDLSDRSYGTALAIAVGGVGGDARTLEDMCILSVEQATAKIQEYQTFADLPDAELLQGVKVTEFVQERPDVIKLTVELANINNEKANLRLPIDVVSTRSLDS